MNTQRDRIRLENDQLRQDFSKGQVVMTRAVANLGEETVSRIFKAVAQFVDFNDSNDPWHEHDAAGLELDGHKLFWKIDYFSVDLEMHSPDPSDPSVTKRILTVGLASDW